MRRKQIIKNVGSIIEKLPQHQINIKESSDYGISLEFEVRIKKLGGKPIDLKTFTCAKRLFISDVYGNRPRGPFFYSLRPFWDKIRKFRKIIKILLIFHTGRYRPIAIAIIFHIFLF